MTVARRDLDSLPTPVTIDIFRRGQIDVWDCAPTEPVTTAQVPLLLLHGWNVDATLNFASAVPALCMNRRVVLFDQHGHGRGIRCDEPFDFGHCANDAAAVLDELQIERAIILGYSLGGAVAQVMASEHPNRCAGLVLAATADTFAESRREIAQFRFLAQGARAMKRLGERPRDAAFRRISAQACRRYPPWVLDAVLAADPVTLLEAGAELGRFDASLWSHSLGVPSAMVVTAADTVVPPSRQHRLARLVRADEVIEVPADHDLPIRNDPRFAEALARAVDVVAIAAIDHSLG